MINKLLLSSAGQAYELFMTIDPDLSKQRHGWWWGKPRTFI